MTEPKNKSRPDENNKTQLRVRGAGSNLAAILKQLQSPPYWMGVGAGSISAATVLYFGLLGVGTVIVAGITLILISEYQSRSLR